MKLYMFRTVRLSSNQEFIHCKLSSGICHTGLWTAFEQDQDGTQFEFTVNKLLIIGQTDCPKHVEFHDKINL